MLPSHNSERTLLVSMIICELATYFKPTKPISCVRVVTDTYDNSFLFATIGYGVRAL